MPLSFNRNFEPHFGEAVPVAPGVRRVTAPNPGPFTFQGTNTYLVGDQQLAVLDPGPADPGHIQALLRAIGTAEVAHILVSHAHQDHAPGARLLQDAIGAPIISASPQAGSGRIDIDAVGGLDAAADLVFQPDIVLRDGATIDGPGYRLESIATPGHAADHFAFALADGNLIFSGDHVMGWATTVVAPPDGSMRDYMASLNRLLDRTEDLYLPAHGGEIRDARSYVRALRAHRMMREQAIVERLRRGDRTISELVQSIYAGLDRGLLGAAALSTFAHLEHLAERGMVATDGTLRMDGRYWPAAAEGVSPDGAEAGESAAGT